MDIGFIGLGKMGKGVAAHLLAAGHQVRVWNRSPEPVKELAANGAKPVAKPADLGTSQVIMTLLANDAAVRSVILDQGVLAAAAPGSIHINLTTISVAFAKELADLHRQRNVGYVAAPVFGRPNVAAEGKLNIVVAGNPATITRAHEALAAISQKIWPVGDREEWANAVKIAGNFMIASAIQSMGEAVALTRAHGIAAKDFLEILTSTLFASPVYKGYGAMIAAERYQPAGFEVTLALKDIRLALSAADALNVPMPFASVLRDSLVEAVATGGADDDWGSLARVAARHAGLERRTD
jgi:3-hydroxyisobutyrate dehydrogenase-like beta-hydroxyacid dehydrogenase